MNQEGNLDHNKLQSKEKVNLTVDGSESEGSKIEQKSKQEEVEMTEDDFGEKIDGAMAAAFKRSTRKTEEISSMDGVTEDDKKEVGQINAEAEESIDALKKEFGYEKGINKEGRNEKETGSKTVEEETHPVSESEETIEEESAIADLASERRSKNKGEESRQASEGLEGQENELGANNIEKLDQESVETNRERKDAVQEEVEESAGIDKQMKEENSAEEKIEEELPTMEEEPLPSEMAAGKEPVQENQQSKQQEKGNPERAESPENNEKQSLASENKISNFEKSGAEKKEGEEKIEDALNLDKFNISFEDLNENIAGFKDLSDGQKALVAKNFKQITLSQIQEKAGEKQVGNASQNKILGSKLLGGFVKGLTKHYDAAKLEKTTARELQEGGLEMHGKTIQQLVDGLKNYGPEADIEDGNLKIKYANEKDFGENLNPRELEKIGKFNDAANKFGKIPDEWGMENASKTEKVKYLMAKFGYNRSRNKALRVAEKNMGTEEAMKYMNNAEYKVQMNRLLQTHPDAEEQLMNIRDKTVVQKILKDTITDKGAYMMLGGAVRSLATGAAGILGAPVAAGLTGGARSWFRAKGELQSQEKKMRKGDEEGNTAGKKFSDIEKQLGRMDQLNQKLSSEDIPENKRAVYEKSLKLKTAWLEDKIKKGLINYGEESGRVGRQYELIQSLSRAKVELESHNLDDKYTRRFQNAIGERDQKSKEKAKDFKKSQAWKGAKTAAAFGVAGYAIADAFASLFSGDEAGVADFSGENMGTNQVAENLKEVSSGGDDISEILDSKELQEDFSELRELRDQLKENNLEYQGFADKNIAEMSDNELAELLKNHPRRGKLFGGIEDKLDEVRVNERLQEQVEHPLSEAEVPEEEWPENPFESEGNPSEETGGTTDESKEEPRKGTISSGGADFDAF